MADVPFWVSFLLGVLAFLSPCIIPMIIVYLTAITGLSVEELAGLHKRTGLRRHVLFSSIAFVLAFSFVFILLGGTAGFIGNFFSQTISNYSKLMELIGGLFFILFGLQFLGVLIKFNFLQGLKNKIQEKIPLSSLRNENGFLNIIGIFLIGLFFAIVCSHCFGYVFYPLLVTTAASSSVTVGLLNLFFFSFGLGIPFILVGLFFSESLIVLEFLKQHYKLVSVLVGLFLVFYGLILVSGNFLTVQGFFLNNFPDILKLVK